MKTFKKVGSALVLHAEIGKKHWGLHKLIVLLVALRVHVLLTVVVQLVHGHRNLRESWHHR
jgi:hypothetical protein